MPSHSMKATYNRARLSVSISPQSPLLIKAGDNLDPARPDMQFVRLRTPELNPVYLPGSSLKGAIRSSAERLLRTLGVKPEPCDPLDMRQSCSGRRQLPYSRHCPACRTFGSTNIASHVQFTDAFPWPVGAPPDVRKTKAAEIEQYIQVRPGVAIDRQKGSVKGGALFELEVVTGGTFCTEIVARNYQLWQLGLLLLVFDEVNEGWQKLGYARTRGLGRVRIDVTGILIEQFGELADTENLKGIGAIEELVKSYALRTNGSGLEPSVRVEEGEQALLGVQFQFTDKAKCDEVGTKLRGAVGILVSEGHHAGQHKG